MAELTELERAVFASICERWPDFAPALTEQLTKAQVIGRENSGAGFFTSFQVDPSTPSMPPGHPDAADAEIAGLVHGMGFVLFTDASGRIDFLEGYTYGEPDSTVALDLHNLVFRLRA